jgi:hypothetical protein
MTEEEKRADEVECAYIRLKGATERLMMVLQHRSERNYSIAAAAVAFSCTEWQRVRYPVAQTNGQCGEGK